MVAGNQGAINLSMLVPHAVRLMIEAALEAEVSASFPVSFSRPFQ